MISIRKGGVTREVEEAELRLFLRLGYERVEEPAPVPAATAASEEPTPEPEQPAKKGKAKQ